MGMEHDFHVRMGKMNGGMDDKTSRVHVPGTTQYIPIFIDLDQVRCRNFVVKQPEFIEQELV